MNTFKNIAVIALLSVSLFGCKDTASQPTKEIATTKNTKAPAKNPQTATFHIEGMTCAIGCAKTIEDDLSNMEGVQKASVDFEKKQATVNFDADQLSADDLVKKAEAAADGATYKVSELKVGK
jgi:copper chaperone CopZ